MKRTLAEILKEEGFIKDFEYIEDGKQGILRLYLKYGVNKQKVITGIKRISKPGLRYMPAKINCPEFGRFGHSHHLHIHGVMSDKKPGRKAWAEK